jgi:hypothetical protein
MTANRTFPAKAAEDPTRFYRRPKEVLTDERLTHVEKLRVLEAWELLARDLAVAAEEGMTGKEPNLLSEVASARIALDDVELDEEPLASTKHGAVNSRRKRAQRVDD